MKRIIALLLALVMTVSLVACNTNEEKPTEMAATEAVSVDTEATSENVEQQYLKLRWENINSTNSGFMMPCARGNYSDTFLIWSSLLRVDIETGEIIYDLAEKMEVSDDGLTYTFTLADAYWHDGTPVTAEDVVFTYNAAVLGPDKLSATRLVNIVGYEAAYNGEADSLEGIYAKDDKTVVFELTQPNYLLTALDGNANLFATSMLSILPAHILGQGEWADIEANAYWANPIGTGPYKIEEAAYPSYCVLTRYDDYHREAAATEKVLLTAYADTESQLAAAMAGECYSIRSIDKASAENAIAQNPDLAYFEHDSAFTRSFEYAMFPTTEYPELQKAEVRKAINMIIDKQAIADSWGAATPATNYNNNHEYNTDIPKWERDVETGVQMLKDAGFDFGKTFKILAYYTDQATVDILDIVVANLAEAGITAEYTIDAQTPNDSFSTGAYAMIYRGVGYNTSVYNMVVPNGAKEIMFVGFDSERRAQYADLWNTYTNTPDSASRKAVASELQALYMEDMYLIPVYFMNTGYLVNTAKLQGWTGVSNDNESLFDYDFSQWVVVE